MFIKSKDMKIIKLRGIYDSSSKRLMVEFSNPFLEKYWEIFSDIMSESISNDVLPKKTEFKKLAENKALIIIPCKLNNFDDLEDGERISNSDLPDVVTKNLSEVLESFSRTTMDTEMDQLEFIPLQGCSLEKMKDDVILAIKDKRDLCLIDTLKNYEKLENKEIFTTYQIRIPYLNNDYADIAYYIVTGNKTELKKYKTKLRKSQWI